MATKSETRKPEDHREFTCCVTGRWVTYITKVVTAGITSVLMAVIAVVVTILVLFGGLWLAYAYLPVHVFHIILAVLIADMALGIVLRAVLSRR